MATSIDTLKLLKKTDRGLDTGTFIDDRFIRAAFQAAGQDYDKALKNYAPLPLVAKDAATGKPITDFRRLAQIWVRGEDKVRHYASPEAALAALAQLEQEGKDIRAIYAQAADSGIKLLANQAWFVRNDKGELSAFLLRTRPSATPGRTAARRWTSAAPTRSRPWPSADALYGPPRTYLMTALYRWPLRLASLAACLLCWQLAATARLDLGLITFSYVPTPGAVLEAAWQLVHSSKLLAHLQ